jgi:phosphoglycerate dehydrogenase-like enzyme
MWRRPALSNVLKASCALVQIIFANVDIPYASSKGVVVMNTPFGNSFATAEHAIALMFALARQLPEANARTQAGLWPKNGFMGVEVTGKTLSLIGAGNLGSIVADRALGLRMKVIAFDPFLSPERGRLNLRFGRDPHPNPDRDRCDGPTGQLNIC